MRPIDPTRFIRDVAPLPVGAPPAIEGLPSPARDFGPAPQLMWIEVKLLVIDEAYQRPISPQGERNIRTIVTEFDWRRFATVVVAPVVGGFYAIVDGQHRTTGAAAVGHEKVPCQVIQADRAAQARAFNAINGIVTRVTKTQQFKAALAGGDPVATRLAAVAAAAGVRILTSNKQASIMSPAETLALDSIRRAITGAGEQVTVRALKAIVASAGERGGLLRGPIVTAVVEALRRRPDWISDPRLDEAFAAIDLDEEWRKASAFAAPRKGISTADALSETVTHHLEATVGRPSWSPPGRDGGRLERGLRAAGPTAG